MIREDTAWSDLNDDVDTQAAEDGEHPYEQISCPTHRGYKLQLLCTKDNFTPALLCIKCLIDPATQRAVSGNDLVYIRETISKALGNEVPDSQIQAAKEKLERKFAELTSVDYLGNFEQHSETQLKKLEREIVSMKESLDYLYSRFKQIFDKQFKILNEKQDGLTAKTKAFIDEQEEVDNLRNSNPKQIMEAIGGISDLKEYEKLVRALYSRASLNEGATEGTKLDEIFEIIDEIKSNVTALMNFRIETDKLREMRHSIESLELIDQSLHILPDCLLAPDAMQTLEKIRNVGRKKGYLSPQKDQTVDLLELFQAQERLSKTDEKDAQNHPSDENLMQLELPPRFEFHVKREKISEAKGVGSFDSPLHPPKGFDSNFIRTTTETGTQTTDFETAAATNDDEYYRRLEAVAHQRQKISGASYRLEKTSRERLSEINFHEEGYKEHGDDDAPCCCQGHNEGEDFPFTTFQKREEHSRAQRPLNDYDYNLQRARGMQLMSRKDIKQEIIRSPCQELSRRSECYYDQGQPLGMIKAEARERTQRQNFKVKKENLRRGQQCRDEPYIDSDEDERGEQMVSPGLSPKKRCGKRISGLHDWINRRITGYLVFQNTIHGTLEKEDFRDSHLNRVAGQKWRVLSKAEKEQYKMLALKVRVELKKDFRDVDKDSPELKELQELIEKEIKKVKKE